ncbi:hypothetical protein LWI29_010830 [Acer saccharum]|uniref:F-box associated domain-containing protein n=1 Tax=Acer saccharum TaxID=4024 RepID=A0AA39VMV1_ACESA|nr:hypothetical protein LWI29_010830 [Acer saccharum]
MKSDQELEKEKEKEKEMNSDHKLLKEKEMNNYHEHMEQVSGVVSLALTIGLHYYDNKNIVVCDGIMYWMSYGKKREIVAYDPLDTNSCRVIDSSDLELEYCGLHVPEVKASLLEVTKGRLRLLQYVAHMLWVWELEDYNKQAKWIR